MAAALSQSWRKKKKRVLFGDELNEASCMKFHEGSWTKHGLLRSFWSQSLHQEAREMLGKLNVILPEELNS